MRPAPVGWLVLLALACALVLAGIAGLEIQTTQRVRAQLAARVDSLTALIARGQCVWIADTVRNPTRRTR